MFWKAYSAKNLENAKALYQTVSSLFKISSHQLSKSCSANQLILQLLIPKLADITTSSYKLQIWKERLLWKDQSAGYKKNIKAPNLNHDYYPKITLVQQLTGYIRLQVMQADLFDCTQYLTKSKFRCPKLILYDHWTCLKHKLLNTNIKCIRL